MVSLPSNPTAKLRMASIGPTTSMPKIDPEGPVRVAIVGTPGDLEAAVWEISESIEVASLGPNPGPAAIREQASTVILVGLGRLDDAALDTELDRVRELLAASGEAHLKAFLDAWQAGAPGTAA